MSVRSMIPALAPLVALFATSAFGHPAHDGAAGAEHITQSWLHALPLVVAGLLAGLLSARVGAATAVLGAVVAIVGLSAAAHLGFGYSTAFLMDSALAATGLAVAGYGAGALLSRRLVRRGARNGEG